MALDFSQLMSLVQKLWDVSIYRTFSEPLLYVGTAVILMLERLLPLKAGQKTFTTGFAHDIAWVALESVFGIVILASFVGLLTAFYHAYLSFLTIPMDGVPLLLKFAIWILVLDFLDWLHHWVKHKVPWIWELHAVHHSQKEMSLFTDQRYHGLEYPISRTFVTLPMLILQADINQILYYMLFHEWYTHTYHARIRTNYGWLRYVFVTPQSHRVHHSIERIHQDKNFGVIFSFWDRLFGTQYTGYDEYPETGIRDKDFPLERSVGGLSLILTPLKQNLYPLGAIFKMMVSPLRRGGG